MTVTKTTTTTIECQFTLPVTLKDLRAFMEEASDFSNDAKVQFKVSEPDYESRVATEPATVKITLTQNGSLSPQRKHVVGLYGAFDK
jgi:hypothetical protein